MQVLRGTREAPQQASRQLVAAALGFVLLWLIWLADWIQEQLLQVRVQDQDNPLPFF